MAGLFLLVSAATAAAPAPFVWALRVGGASVSAAPGPIETGVAGWSCALAIEAPRTTSDTTEQAGTVTCESPRGEAVETMVLCMTDTTRPGDLGSGSLIVTRGQREVAIELSCRSPGLEARPRLQLEPGRPPSTHTGVPTERTAPTPGTYRWRLSAGGADAPIDTPGPVAVTTEGWTCAQQVSGVTDPSWGYAEYATLACEARGTRFTTIVACSRAPAEPHVCQAGNLRIAPAGGPFAGVLLLCEDVGNPGCFE